LPHPRNLRLIATSLVVGSCSSRLCHARYRGRVSGPRAPRGCGFGDLNMGAGTSKRRGPNQTSPGVMHAHTDGRCERAPHYCTASMLSVRARGLCPHAGVAASLDAKQAPSPAAAAGHRSCDPSAQHEKPSEGRQAHTHVPCVSFAAKQLIATCSTVHTTREMSLEK
jgi:hypothetical protein